MAEQTWRPYNDRKMLREGYTIIGICTRDAPEGLRSAGVPETQKGASTTDLVGRCALIATLTRGRQENSLFGCQFLRTYDCLAEEITLVESPLNPAANTFNE